MKTVFALFALVCALFWPLNQAGAHTVPDSHVNLRLGPNAARAEVTASWSGLTHDILPLGGPDNPVPASPEVVAANKEAIATLLMSQFHVEIAGRSLMATAGEMALTDDGKSVRAELTFPWRDAQGNIIPPPDSARVHGLLFPSAVGHRTILSIYRGEKLEREDILQPGNSSVEYKIGATQSPWDVVKQFVREGIHHIFIGPDHICFIIGLLLAGGTLKQLLKIITAFTVAHSITLALAALGIISPSASIVEPGIALTIVIVGVYSLRAMTQGKSENRTGARDLRLYFAFFFGLIHGFGFAGALSELELPRWALGWSLLSFNIGVELGQACIVLMVAPLLAYITRIRPVLGGRIAYAASLAVIFAGAVWFVQRVWPS